MVGPMEAVTVTWVNLMENLDGKTSDVDTDTCETRAYITRTGRLLLLR